MSKSIEIRSLEYFRKYFSMPNQGLRSYFGRVVEGQSEVILTPFGKHYKPDSVMQDWLNHLEPLKSKWPTLYQFEMDMSAKVGPMSVMKPLSERIADIDAYYEGIRLPSVPINQRAIKAVIHEFTQAKGLHPRSTLSTVDHMKLSTNSGSPYFTKKRNVVGMTIPYIVKPIPPVTGYPGVLQCINHEVFGACAVLGWRGQEGGPKPTDVKQRVVWMFPFSVNIGELSVYQPLIELAQKFNLVPAWIGMDNVDYQITQMFDSKKPKDVVVCTDFTKFDQHFNKDMSNGALHILSSILDNTQDSISWLDQIFPIKYMIPLAYDYGKIRYGWHGMGSGSGGTNADETLTHRALQYEAAIAQNQRLNTYSQCLGDDGVITFNNLNVDKLLASYTSHGQVMNPSKQNISYDDCIYLRRWHHNKYRYNNICVGVYSTCRALGRLMYQERFYDPEVWGPKMVALRMLSILENVSWHPLRDQFAEFCMKRDRYRLGLDIPGFIENIEQYAQESIDYIPDFLGYTKSLSFNKQSTGIGNWWIVKYLKSKA